MSRLLLALVVLALPAAALADPCGQPGLNCPLTAQTRPSGQAVVTPGVQPGPNAAPSGSLDVITQAYPH